MSESSIIHLVIQSMATVFLLSMPLVIVATTAGLLVSILQTLTQIQDQTLSFAVKLIAAGATIALSAKWMSAVIFRDAVACFDLIHTAAR